MTQELEIGDQITVRGTVADWTAPCVKVRFEGRPTEPVWIPRRNIATNDGQPIKVGDTVIINKGVCSGPETMIVLAIHEEEAWVKYERQGTKLICKLNTLRRA